MGGRAALRGIIAGLSLLVPMAARAQRVTKVPSGDTIVVEGVGKVRLLGIDSMDESAFERWQRARAAAAARSGRSRRRRRPTIANGGIKFHPGSAVA
mgnify:CR=1 FL=1